MRSHVIGIIEMDERVEPTALAPLPSDPSDWFEDFEEVALRSDDAYRSGAAGISGGESEASEFPSVLLVAADTVPLRQELHEEYRQLLRRFFPRDFQGE